MPSGIRRTNEANDRRVPYRAMNGFDDGERVTAPDGETRYRGSQPDWDPPRGTYEYGAFSGQRYGVKADPHMGGNTGGYGENMSRTAGADASRFAGGGGYYGSSSRRENAYGYSHDGINGHSGHGRDVSMKDSNNCGKPPRRNMRALLIVIAVLIVAGGIFAAVNAINSNNKAKAMQELSDAVRPYDDKYCEGVYVNGVNLGGMTADQAYASVQTVIQQQNSVWRVRLVLNGSPVAEITADMLGLGPDSPQVYNAIAQTLNDAWLQGHTGNDAQRKSSMDTLKNNPYIANVQMPAADTSVIDPILQQIKSQIETPPTDASVIAFDPYHTVPFTYNQESNGVTLDTAPLERQLYDMVSNHQAGEIVISPTVVEPGVKVADLKKDHTLLASVATDISTTSTEDRNENIRRAMELINGTILQPGQQFSFNDVVGERTVKNGFLTAIEYAYGEHVEGVGGGVCQASSTLYQAAVKAGLQILKRSPHSDSVSYAEYGKDATVYWVGKRKIDLVFKNNTDKPVYIVASVQNAPNSKKRLVTKISIYGRDPGDVRYDLETKTIETLSIPDPEITKDKEGTYAVYDDEMVQVTDGKLGYVVESYQVQYTGKYETDRKLLYVDTYKPQAPKVYVGIQKRAYV